VADGASFGSSGADCCRSGSDERSGSGKGGGDEGMATGGSNLVGCGRSWRGAGGMAPGAGVGVGTAFVAGKSTT